ncbi:MAG: phosphate ABC transporter permease PstA [Thermodesulfobacteriota bacterium]|nr:phosphate ABC transporter permease PstA [Thermodesulfobacteriota bacterium]
MQKPDKKPDNDTNNTQGHSQFPRLRRRRIVQSVFFFLFRTAALINAAALFLVGYFVISKGASVISWEFLTRPPTDAMTKGGIMPAIIGTFYLSAGAMLIALPVGVASAIYMNEYARKGRLIRIIRFGINNLAGVPSIVFGLFGLAFFCIVLNFNVSLIAGALTLAALTLPVVIGATEEALKAVPDTYREASLALGATKWQTIYRVVIPTALPEILTGAILGLGRAAGETAPIMFTAAVYYTPHLPSSLFDEVMALPYHIYVLATAGTNIAQTRPLQYGTALVLIVLVCGMNLFAIIVRSRMRKKLKG